MQSAKEYLIEEGLNQYINLDANAEFNEGAFDAVSGKLNIPFRPSPFTPTHKKKKIIYYIGVWFWTIYHSHG